MSAFCVFSMTKWPFLICLPQNCLPKRGYQLLIRLGFTWNRSVWIFFGSVPTVEKSPIYQTCDVCFAKLQFFKISFGNYTASRVGWDGVDLRPGLRNFEPNFEPKIRNILHDSAEFGFRGFLYFSKPNFGSESSDSRFEASSTLLELETFDYESTCHFWKYHFRNQIRLTHTLQKRHLLLWLSHFSSVERIQFF